MYLKRLYIYYIFYLITGVFTFPVILIAQANGETASAYSYLKGIPKIIHYTKNDYHSDSQFWTMCEDDQGILYFGNNDGVLIFDGERWQLLRLPNGSTVRSLKYCSDGNIYAGGYSELGIVKKDENGKYYFESLVHLVRNEDRNFADVWQIHESQGYVVFRSFKTLIAIKNEKAITLPADHEFIYSNVINGRYYVIDGGLKKVDFQNLNVENVLDDGIFIGEEVAGIHSVKNDTLILFTKKGLSYFIYPEQRSWRFNRNHLTENSSDQIFCVIKASTGDYYLGTINNQIYTYTLAQSGKDKQNKLNHLQDNTVLGLYETSEGNIWALLNKGVDCIEVSSPIAILFDNAAVYDAITRNDLLYLATNQGVYVTQVSHETQYTSRPDFKLMDGLEAQAWTMNQYEGKILVGHDKGVFVIDGLESYRIKGTSGIWKVIPMESYPGKYLACTYGGLLLLSYENGKFELENPIEGFDLSTRDIMPTGEKGAFWVCHGYKGVYKIKINEALDRIVSIEHYIEQHGLPSHYSTNVFKWKDEIVFTTTKGIYHFNEKKDRFEVFEPLTNALPENHVYRKILHQNDRTWFIQDDMLGYVDMDQEGQQPKKDLFLSLKGNFIKTMELIVPVNKNMVLVGTNNALYQFDLAYGSITTGSAQTLITNISYKNPEDSLKSHFLSLHKNKSITLPYNTPDLRFEFATPEFIAQSGIQYSYILEDIDETWSSWQSTPYKEYSYLQSGKYTFRVRSRSLLGEKSAIASFSFEILPVWYQTKSAVFIFSILGLIGLVLTVILVRRKIRKTKEEERKLRKVLELELQQIKLEQEKARIIEDKKELEKDVVFKSKELANYTMLLVKKRELLIEMHQELKSLRGLVKNDKSRQKIRELNKKINFNLQDEEHLKIFEVNFERVHQDFFQNLKSTYPELSQKDLQLCAFVKMNLSNKEIASILNISVRGVETARYRLRKRLNLNHDENMIGFFESLGNEQEIAQDRNE